MHLCNKILLTSELITDNDRMSLMHFILYVSLYKLILDAVSDGSRSVYKVGTRKIFTPLRALSIFPIRGKGGGGGDPPLEPPLAVILFLEQHIL